MVNLRQLDLNLLVTLDVLLAEQNVTRAAQRLSYSQPSISVHLAKLRDLFDDPLLLPGPRGMRPTARALALREPLRQALAGLEEAVAPLAPFDPAEARDTWRVAASDGSASSLVLPALQGVRQAAPHTRLALLQLVPARLARQAEEGEVDMAFHTRDEAPESLRSRVLFTERYVLVGRQDHPRLRRRPTLAQFCKLEQVIVSPDGGGFSGVTDSALAAVGLSRKVVLSVAHFLLVPNALASTDLVALLPERLVRGHPALRVVEPPLALPTYQMTLLWPERCHRDPGHRWLREFMVQALGEG
ncbi:LysR family transcriptional regulator [Pseudomonas silvicola]|nr:LysR family transcriptional regulator [Pseudomonas silvicola]